MKRWRIVGWLGALAGSMLTLGICFFLNTKSGAIDEPPLSVSPSGKLIMHEWGTFTSFSGSNGVQLDFRPLINEDLPGFVMDREQHSGQFLLTKGRIRARIRMETPVTYFYTDRERTIRAKVEFPQGLLTEFYPPVVAMAPSFNPVLAGREPFGNSMLDWGEIHLIPTSLLAPNVKDPATRNWLQQRIEQQIVPSDGSASNHYYYARATDSAIVHIHKPEVPDRGRAAQDHLEKFLFYRGLGRFEQPLRATVSDDGRIQVTNTGDQPIRSLFRVTVTSGALRYSVLNSVAGGVTAEFPATTAEVSRSEILDVVAKALVRENLYEREATAMVHTWADSWFAEEGTRIFYMIPQSLTDKLLPLTISPPPDESVRVLVGRLEVMSPALERKLLEVVSARAKARVIHQQEKLTTPLPIPEEFIKLGRLAEPALVRLQELAAEDAVSYEAGLLLRECRDAAEIETAPN